MHFGHCERFALLDVDLDARAITVREDLTPPPHEPGVLPRWLAEQGVGLVLAGGGSNVRWRFSPKRISAWSSVSRRMPQSGW